MAICSAALICSSDHNVLRLLGDGFFINLEHTSFAESIEGSLTQVHSQLPSITIDIIRWQITGRGRLTNKGKIAEGFLGCALNKRPRQKSAFVVPTICTALTFMEPTTTTSTDMLSPEHQHCQFCDPDPHFGQILRTQWAYGYQLTITLTLCPLNFWIRWLFEFGLC